MVNQSLRHARILAGATAPLPITNHSPLNYLGGKCKVADQLWLLRPSPKSFSTIIDPFGGGAATPLAFARFGVGTNKRFLIRDAFQPTINFWQVLQSKPTELTHAVDDLFAAYPDGHALEAACLDAINLGQDSGNLQVKSAAGYYIHTHVCVPACQFKIDKASYSQMRGGKWLPTGELTIGRLHTWSEMISGWDFQVQDFKATMAEAIALGDAGFAFIDPPYEGSGAGDTPDVLYSATFGKAAHDLLANKVTEATNAGVKTMITINHSPANMERYAAYKRIIRTQAYSTRKKGSNAKKVGTELVIQTYESPFFNTMIANTNWKVVEDEIAA